MKHSQSQYRQNRVWSHLQTLACFLVLTLATVSSPSWAQSGKPGAHSGAFKELQNLQLLAQQSHQTGLPIMLMFGAEWCEFCGLLNEAVLNPMAMNPNYDGKAVLMRHVGVDEQALIPGFDGKPIKKSQWAYQLNADLTPTVIFIDGNGREVAPRIVGISNIELYAGLIHRNLNMAYEKMGTPFRLPATPELYEQQGLLPAE